MPLSKTDVIETTACPLCGAAVGSPCSFKTWEHPPTHSHLSRIRDAFLKSQTLERKRLAKISPPL